MYTNLSSLKEQDDPNTLSSLLVAPPALRCTATTLMNNFRSPLVLYVSEPPSKGTNLEYRLAVIDIGAEVHIWNLKDAMVLFSNLQIT